MTVLGLGDASAAVRAGVKKGLGRTIFLTHHDDGIDPQLGGQIIAGLWYLVGHATDIPDGVPDILVLAPQIIRAGVSITAHRITA